MAVTVEKKKDAPSLESTVAAQREADRWVGMRIFLAMVWCGAIAAVILVAHNARYGAVEERIRNDAVQGAPRPVAPLVGGPTMLTQMQIGTVVLCATMFAVCFVLWRRYPRHPYILMMIVTTTIVWQDPIMNWAPYAVYNPQLWHWPENWPLVSLSPTVEPFVVFGYAAFYFLPFFPAMWILRAIQKRRPVTSFVWRHPLISLSILIYIVGFIYDAGQEIFVIKAQLYIYSQVIPFGSVFTGQYNQFPLLWESSLVTTVMIPAGVLVYRDDTGKTVAEKLAQRLKFFRGRPTLGTFVVMFVILNGAYLFLYGGSFALIKASGKATSVACPYPFPEAKVYDPQGYYEMNGQPGPYFEGNWSGWMSGQPDGRPQNITPPADGGRCSPQNVESGSGTG
jgi:hypothetical protein